MFQKAKKKKKMTMAGKKQDAALASKSSSKSHKTNVRSIGRKRHEPRTALHGTHQAKNASDKHALPDADKAETPADLERLEQALEDTLGGDEAFKTAADRSPSISRIEKPVGQGRLSPSAASAVSKQNSKRLTAKAHRKHSDPERKVQTRYPRNSSPKNVPGEQMDDLSRQHREHLTTENKTSSHKPSTTTSSRTVAKLKKLNLKQGVDKRAPERKPGERSSSPDQQKPLHKKYLQGNTTASKSPHNEDIAKVPREVRKKNRKMPPNSKETIAAKGRKVDEEPQTERTSSKDAHSPLRTKNLESMRNAIFKMSHRRGGIDGILTPKEGASTPDKSKNKNQVLDDDDDDDDEDEVPEHMSFLLVAGGVVVALGVLFLGVWTFGVIIGKALQALNGTLTFKNRHFIRELMKACTSKECRDAVSALHDSVRVRGVDPCSDFYNFACGLWDVPQQGLIGGGNHSGTYRHWLEENYVASVHAMMLRVLSAADNHSDHRGYNASRQAARAYNSCLTFFTNGATHVHLASMWKAAGVDPAAWIRAANFSQLFAYIIQTALDNHLMSVVRIDYDKTGTVRVHPGKPIEQSSGESGLTIALLEEASSALGLLNEHEVRTAIDRLDGVVRAVGYGRLPANKRVPPQVDKDALDFEAYGIRLFAVLEAYASSRLLPAPRSLHCSDISGVRDILRALADSPLHIAGLYALLTPFAPYAAFARNISMQSQMREKDLQKSCLSVLHTQFGQALHTIIAADEEGEDKTADTVKVIWKHVRSTALERLTIAKTLELDKKVILQSRASFFKALRGLKPVDPETDAAFQEPYTDYFLANLILNTRLTGRRIDISRGFGSLHLRRGRFAVVHLRPDFLYPMAPEPSVNYGTMGALVASVMFDSALRNTSADDHREGDSENTLGECLASYAKRTLKVELKPEDWKANLKARWAVETALLATRRNHNFLKRSVFDRFLLVRFGRTYCGEKFRSPLEFATMSSSLFADAFACPRRAVLNC